jgi:hypothetical protein
VKGQLNKLTISALLMTATTLSMPATAAEPIVGTPSGKERDRYQLSNVHADMTEKEYRQAYRNNRGQIQNFIEDYSESSLASLGLPRKGVHLIGAVAGAAITQDATFYVNKSKFMAVEIRDAAEDDRSIFFGLKVDW